MMKNEVMYNSSEKEKEEKQSRNIVFTFHPDSALALADSSFRFNPFSSSPSQQQQQAGQTANPKGADFDPEALERGAKALLEINSSPHAKQVLIIFLISISILNFLNLLFSNLRK